MNEPALLLRLAREAIAVSFFGGEVDLPEHPWLHEPRAVFVTLRRRDGALRGCVGSLEPVSGLGHAVIAAARAAAFRDDRFAPVASAELADLRLDISVMSPLTPLPVADEAEACLLLEESRPGVVLAHGRKRGVFLPKVWASLPAAAEFLRHLKMKAGLPAEFWSPALRLDVFTCEEFAEPDELPPGLEAS